MKTHVPNADQIDKNWVVVDATGQRLGRLATQVATLLRGKHKPIYTPHLDTGDFVIVVNASKIELSGNKIEQKEYFSHSRYPGGSRIVTAREAMQNRPEWVVRKAIWGMIPHNRLGRAIIKKLKVYADDQHPHEAQQPVDYKLLNQ
ncbi:50S ribosomal protein L13 [Calditrichota bacterium]